MPVQVNIMSTIDKRRHVRINSLNLSYVCVNDKGEAVSQGMGRTLNVSESGILLETHFNIDLEQILSLTVALEEELMDIDGRVVHRREKKDGRYETGVEFLKTDEAEFQILKRFIQLFRDV